MVLSRKPLKLVSSGCNVRLNKRQTICLHMKLAISVKNVFFMYKDNSIYATMNLVNPDKEDHITP